MPRRAQLVAGGIAAVVVAVVVVLLVAGGGGGDDEPEPRSPVDLRTAVRKAGCTFKEFPDEGQRHLPSRDSTYDGYRTNPPTSGPHRPPPAAADGVYLPGRSPDEEDWVHTLEHGRVIFMYAPREAGRRDQVEALMDEPVGDEPAGFKTVVMENNTGMPFAVAAVSWRRYVGCPRLDAASLDALRAFRLRFVGDAPEGDFPWPAQ
jgi:hypothetical protein